MQDGVTPELLNFIITLAQYMLIAFGILIAGAALVYTTMFWKGHFTGTSVARILQQTDIPKLATIILIVLAASLLGLLRVIAGEAELPDTSSATGPRPRKRRRTDRSLLRSLAFASSRNRTQAAAKSPATGNPTLLRAFYGQDATRRRI